MPLEDRWDFFSHLFLSFLYSNHKCPKLGRSKLVVYVREKSWLSTLIKCIQNSLRQRCKFFKHCKGKLGGIDLITIPFHQSVLNSLIESAKRLCEEFGKQFAEEVLQCKQKQASPVCIMCKQWCGHSIEEFCFIPQTCCNERLNSWFLVYIGGGAGAGFSHLGEGRVGHTSPKTRVPVYRFIFLSWSQQHLSVFLSLSLSLLSLHRWAHGTPTPQGIWQACIPIINLFLSFSLPLPDWVG